MLFKLIATIALALAVAGVLMLLNRFVFKGRLPKWVMPVSIAAAIFIFQISDEYSWYGRQQESLAKGNYAVVNEVSKAQIWRPWSYVAPTVNAVTVINLDHIVPVDGKEGQSRSYLITLTQLGQITDAPFRFDCNEARFAPENPDESKMQWADMPPEVLLAVCGGEG